MTTIDDSLKHDKLLEDTKVVKRYYSNDEEQNLERFEQFINDLNEKYGGNVVVHTEPLLEDAQFWSKYSSQVKVYKKRDSPYTPSLLEEKGIEPGRSKVLKVKKDKYPDKRSAVTALFDKAYENMKMGENMVFIDEVELNNSLFGDKYLTIAKFYSLPETVNFEKE